MNNSYLRPHLQLYIQQRLKTAKFKPKIAKTRPLKSPSALALDHFDFYYGPLFGKKWPSIRLGLLSPHRFVAVMNTMSKSWEAHEEILADMGTMDLLKRIRGKTATETIEEKKKKVDSKAAQDTVLANEFLNDTVLENHDDSSSDELEKVLRGEAGLHEFRKSDSDLTMGSLQMGNKSNGKRGIEVTGFEGEGVRLPRRDHFIYYPDALRLRTFDRAVLLDYPAPMKDDNGVPSYWLLDGASLLPVLALGLEKGDSLLDVCAAPGGKTLLAILSGLPDRIVCNDFKMARLGQLKRALMTYVPTDHEMMDKLILSRKDAGNLEHWDDTNSFDKVLADVPCSTDRLSAMTDDGNIFSPTSTQMRLDLPLLQTRILVNAIRSCKVGGSVVYSTCTLSPSQNEAVVENAVAIAQKEFGIKMVEESLAQLVGHLTATSLFKFNDTPLGALVIPFLPSNFGPMYICKLTRL